MSRAKIFKRFAKPNADLYVFPEADQLKLDDEKNAPPPEEQEEGTEPIEFPGAPADGTEDEATVLVEEPNPLEYAEIQAKAILRDAEEEAEAYRNKALHDLEEELADLRRDAREDGYQHGFAEGIAEGHAQAKQKLESMAKNLEAEVKSFLEEAVYQRDRLLDDSREELKELAIAVAEKVIRVSLKGSSDIILRMIEAATDKHKHCEWAQIYIADCDVKTMAHTIPELTAALKSIARRVRVIPMAGDDSGSCIIEMPDVIIDASVSTQLDNMREILNNTALDQDS